MSNSNDLTSSLVAEDEGEASTDNIAELIALHRAAINKLKSIVADSVPEGATDGLYVEYDDIFYLRYILSLQSPEKAAEPVRRHFAYRSEPATRDMVQKLLNNEWDKDPLVRRVAAFCSGGLLERDASDSLGAVLAVQVGKQSPEGMFESITVEEHLRIMMAYREMAFMACERVTRETGRLAKAAFLFDLTGTKMGMLTDGRLAEMHQRASALSALYYPQLLAKVVLCNTPGWISWVMGVLKQILPARNIDKLEAMDTLQALWASEFARTQLNRLAFPTFLGGAKGAVQAFWQPVTVARRSSATAELKLPADGSARRVRYEVELVDCTSDTLTVSASLRTPADATAAVSRVRARRRRRSSSSKAEAGTILLRASRLGDERTLRGEFLLRRGAAAAADDAAIEGVVVFTFDNTAALLRGKELRFRAEALPLEAKPQPAAGAAGEWVVVPGGEAGDSSSVSFVDSKACAGADDSWEQADSAGGAPQLERGCDSARSIPSTPASSPQLGPMSSLSPATSDITPMFL